MFKHLHKLVSKAGLSLGGHKACIKYGCKKYCGDNPVEAELFYSGGFGSWTADGIRIGLSENGLRPSVKADTELKMSAATSVLMKEKENLLEIIKIRCENITVLEAKIKNYNDVIQNLNKEVQEIDKAISSLEG